MRRPVRSLALGLAALAAPAWAADPYVVDLVRALREWGGRIAIPVFVIHDIGHEHRKTFPRVWRDLEIAEGHGFGEGLGGPGTTDPTWLDRQARIMAARLAGIVPEVPTYVGEADLEETCVEPPLWTPPKRPKGWQPEPRAWVRELQKVLRDRGHYLEAVDGLFGPATRAAVYAYQCAEGLPGEGLTRRTAKALGVSLP
jgi:hypothetical protein